MTGPTLALRLVTRTAAVRSTALFYNTIVVRVSWRDDRSSCGDYLLHIVKPQPMHTSGRRHVALTENSHVNVLVEYQDSSYAPALAK
jgi:hypothetical protein